MGALPWLMLVIRLAGVIVATAASPEQRARLWPKRRGLGLVVVPVRPFGSPIEFGYRGAESGPLTGRPRALGAGSHELRVESRWIAGHPALHARDLSLRLLPMAEVPVLEEGSAEEVRPALKIVPVSGNPGGVQVRLASAGGDWKPGEVFSSVHPEIGGGGTAAGAGSAAPNFTG